MAKSGQQKSDHKTTTTASSPSPSPPSPPPLTKRRTCIYSFKEARRIARGHGFDAREEYLEYSCPGAYRLPQNPDAIWGSDDNGNADEDGHWKGWEDFLGVTYSNFEQAQEIASKLGLQSKEEYLHCFEQKKMDDDDPAIRLPYRPDLHYKVEWKGWEEWLGMNE